MATPTTPGRGGEGRASVTAALVVELLALVPWTGGLAVLGAIVAPTVFGIVPAPFSADAMTVAFRRFDALAITCALVCLFAEVVLVLRGGKTTRLDLARGLAVVVAAGLAILVGAYLSPAIQGLHRAGAIRGHGEAGLALERFHRAAETAAKIELVALVAAVVLLVLRGRRSGHAS